MELKDKIVLTYPVKELWTDEKILSVSRGKHLNSDDIHDLLKRQKIQFVIADVGLKLQWLALDSCYVLYKTTIKSQIIENFDRINLNHFPNNFVYLATLWENECKYPIVLLEKYH